MKRRIMMILTLLLALLIVPHLWTAVKVRGYDHWSKARWDSAGIAGDPSETPEAVVQVYAARAWGWKGVFAVHSWISIKHKGATQYDRYEVVGWGVGRGAPAVRKNRHVPDGYWAGNPPELLVDLRGPDVQSLVERIEKAIAAYPYPDRYVTWPGPNSNTFIAHLGRTVPELNLELPPTAIGKDYLDQGALIASTPSGSGYQLSLFGVLGASLGRSEGIELHILGLTLGIDPFDFAIKLPSVGRIGSR
ncbi:MAG: DUF3750 domain-containing protein [Geminicoccales bacterium]